MRKVHTKDDTDAVICVPAVVDTLFSSHFIVSVLFVQFFIYFGRRHVCVTCRKGGGFWCSLKKSDHCILAKSGLFLVSAKKRGKWHLVVAVGFNVCTVNGLIYYYFVSFFALLSSAPKCIIYGLQTWCALFGFSWFLALESKNSTIFWVEKIEK